MEQLRANEHIHRNGEVADRQHVYNPVIAGFHDRDSAVENVVDEQKRAITIEQDAARVRADLDVRTRQAGVQVNDGYIVAARVGDKQPLPKTV